MSRKLKRKIASRPLVQCLEGRLLLASTSAYVAIELPRVGGGAGGVTWAYAINDAGLAVGESSNHGATAWRVDAANKATAVALPEIYPPGYSYAYDVNELGQVAGMGATGQFVEGSWPVYHAVVWQADAAGNFSWTDLGTLPGDVQSSAFDVNNNGQVLGLSDDSRYRPDGSSGGTYFLWDSVNQMREINALRPAGSGWTLNTATDVNDDGQIVGTGVFEGVSRGYRLDLGSSTIVALPGLTNDSSSPAALNGGGLVVGSAYVRTDVDPYYGPMSIGHAFVSDGAAITNLGSLGDRSSVARGINDGGSIVGWSNSKKRGNVIDLLGINTATMWTRASSGQVTMKDINSLRPPKTPWQITRAFDINDGGTIVTEAYGTSRTNNYTRGLLMQPNVAATTSGTSAASSTQVVADPDGRDRAPAAANVLGTGTMIAERWNATDDEGTNAPVWDEVVPSA